MRSHQRILTVVVLFAATAACDNYLWMAGQDGGFVHQADEDQDGIGDLDEGRPNADTDGDGTPDYLDLDSDGDSVSDALESGGDGDPDTPPPDSDGDGTADFRDIDSDNNGRPDGVDGTSDFDGDGLADFQDLDDDDDHLGDDVEMGPDPLAPRDTDGDLVPDFQDQDSDGDTIADRHELTADPDADSIPAFRDLDSDGDCRLDAVEAGDADVDTPPVDTDADGFGDYLDFDADADGLPDQQEDLDCNGVLGTGESSAVVGDTDGDSVSDLIEVAAGTDPQNSADNPLVNGDFVFVEPYQEAPSPSEDQLDFSVAFRNVDIMFQIDISGSMGTEITTIKNNIASVIGALVCSAGEDPVTTGCIPDLQTGIVTYGNIANPPMTSFGKEINTINLVADGPNSTEAMLPSSAPGVGAEQHLRAIANDDTANNANDGFLRNACASNPARFSRACYRNDSLRLIVQATDEPLNQDTAWNSNSHQPLVDFIVQHDVQLINVWSGSWSSSGATYQDQWSQLASGGETLVPLLTSTDVDTPACNALSSSPFYTYGGHPRAIVQGAEASSVNGITCAVQAVVRFVAQDVGTLAVNDPTNVDRYGNPVDAPSAFIDYIETFMNDSPECPTHPSVQDTNSDGWPDVFVDLLPGRNVCWRIHVKTNQVVEPAAQPQMFRATIVVAGDGGALLDSRDVYFLVPPEIEQPPIG